MMNVMNRVFGMVLGLSLLCGSAFAGPTWICAITESIACTDDGSTGAPDLQGLERPTFLRVDVDTKQVTILAPASRRGETSRIETAKQEGGNWLLGGVEQGRAWTMILTEAGHMTLAITGDGEVWSVFGNTISLADLTVTESP